MGGAPLAQAQTKSPSPPTVPSQPPLTELCLRPFMQHRWDVPKRSVNDMVALLVSYKAAYGGDDWGDGTRMTRS